MRKIKLLLLACILLSGCINKPVTCMTTTAAEGVTAESTAAALQSDIDKIPLRKKNEVEEQKPDVFTASDLNPYSGYGESSTPSGL